MCCVFVAYVFFLHWPPLMLVSFDVQVIYGDADDPAIATRLWRSFLDNRISMLKMTATVKFLFVG